MSADQIKPSVPAATKPHNTPPPAEFADYVGSPFFVRATELLPTEEAEDLAQKLLGGQAGNTEQRTADWCASRCQLIIAMALQDLAASDPASGLAQKSPKQEEALFRKLSEACNGLSDILQEMEAGGSAAEHLVFYRAGPLDDLSEFEAIKKISAGMTDVSRLFRRLSADLAKTKRLAELGVKDANSTKQRHRQNRVSSAARAVFLRHLVDLYHAYTGQLPRISKTEADNRAGTIVWLARELIQKVEPHWNISSLANDLQAIVKGAKLEESLPRFLAD